MTTDIPEKGRVVMPWMRKRARKPKEEPLDQPDQLGKQDQLDKPDKPDKPDQPDLQVQMVKPGQLDHVVRDQLDLQV